MELLGIHHVSAITADAQKNYDFYTNVLGLRLVKKTVNQDDNDVYHLFYGDEIGRPGTDLTFFEIKQAGQTYEGTSSISGTSLRVPNDASLTYWKKRFTEYDVEHEQVSNQAGRKAISFRDPEGQRLHLVSDKNNSGVEGGTPWAQSPVPTKHGIIGLGPTKITVKNAEQTITVLRDVLGFEVKGSYPSQDERQNDILVFSTGAGGAGAEVHLEVQNDLTQEKAGRGSVHHVAFRVEDFEALREWRDLFERVRMPNSGIVDRFYFQSIYFRDGNGIMFELATDGPGFTTDEDSEHLGESLSLPPFLEKKREKIEKSLIPLQTN